MNDPEQKFTTNRRRQIAVGMGGGVALGIALGVAMDNIAIGLVVGILIGSVGAAWRIKKT